MHPVKVTWFINNKLVKSDELKYFVLSEQEIHYLKIKNLKTDDAGEIRAEVSNSFGKVSATCNLLVKCNNFF